MIVKFVFNLLWIAGITAFMFSPLGASVLSGIRYLGAGVTENISGVMPPEIFVFFSMSVFALGLAVYSIFNKN